MMRRLVALAALAFLSPWASAQEPPPSSAGVYVQVSTGFFNAGFGHPVAKTTSVDVPIRKYHVVGLAQLDGHQSYEAAPCGDHARLFLVLTGRTVSCDTSFVRRMHVHTIDRSDVCVRQELFVSAQGIRAGALSLSAPTQSTFQSAGVGGPLRSAMIQSMARMQFRLMPARTNRIATEVSEIVLRQEVGHDVAERMAAADARLRERFLDPLRDLEIPPENVHFASTAGAIQIRLDVPDIRTTPAPPVESSDLSVRIHEAVLNKLLRLLFGGSTQLGKDLEEYMHQLVTMLGNPPRSAPSSQPWSVTFHKQIPIVFRFQRDTLEIVLHGDEFEVGGETLPAMVGTVSFDVRRDAKGHRLVRREPVQFRTVDPAAEKKLSPRQDLLRRALAARLTQLLGPEFDLTRLALPESLGQAAHGLVSRLTTQDGWLAFEWRLQP